MDSFTTLYRQILKENGLFMEDTEDSSKETEKSEKEGSEEKTSFQEAAKNFESNFPFEKVANLCVLPEDAGISFPDHFQPHNYKLELIGTPWNTESAIDTPEERDKFMKFISQNKGTDNPIHPLFYKKLLFYIRAKYRAFKNDPKKLTQTKDSNFKESLTKNFENQFTNNLQNSGIGFLFELFQDKDKGKAKTSISESLQFIENQIEAINNLMSKFPDEKQKACGDETDPHPIAAEHPYNKTVIKNEIQDHAQDISGQRGLTQSDIDIAVGKAVRQQKKDQKDDD